MHVYVIPKAIRLYLHLDSGSHQEYEYKSHEEPTTMHHYVFSWSQLVRVLVLVVYVL